MIEQKKDRNTDRERKTEEEQQRDFCGVGGGAVSLHTYRT
jgi:hypothetical protein